MKTTIYAVAAGFCFLFLFLINRQKHEIIARDRQIQDLRSEIAKDEAIINEYRTCIQHAYSKVYTNSAWRELKPFEIRGIAIPLTN